MLLYRNKVYIKIVLRSLNRFAHFEMTNNKNFEILLLTDPQIYDTISRYAKHSVISVFNPVVYLKDRINTEFFEKREKKVLFRAVSRL